MTIYEHTSRCSLPIALLAVLLAGGGSGSRKSIVSFSQTRPAKMTPTLPFLRELPDLWGVQKRNFLGRRLFFDSARSQRASRRTPNTTNAVYNRYTNIFAYFRFIYVFIYNFFFIYFIYIYILFFNLFSYIFIHVLVNIVLHFPA